MKLNYRLEICRKALQVLSENSLLVEIQNLFRLKCSEVVHLAKCDKASPTHVRSEVWIPNRSPSPANFPNG